MSKWYMEQVRKIIQKKRKSPYHTGLQLQGLLLGGNYCFQLVYSPYMSHLYTYTETYFFKTLFLFYLMHFKHTIYIAFYHKTAYFL